MDEYLCSTQTLGNLYGQKNFCACFLDFLVIELSEPSNYLQGKAMKFGATCVGSALHSILHWHVKVSGAKGDNSTEISHI